jgi:hypothetical protein
MPYGYAGGALGNVRSLAGGFGIASGEWQGWTITKVEVQLKNQAIGNDLSKGNVRIGSHKESGGSPPNQQPPINAGRTTVKDWKSGASKWVNITSWGKGLATNDLKGVVVGPGADQTSKNAGTMRGANHADRPVIRITGYRWE